MLLERDRRKNLISSINRILLLKNLRSIYLTLERKSGDDLSE